MVVTFVRPVVILEPAVKQTVKYKTDMTEQEWESLCHCCGGCCFEKKITSEGTVLTTTVPCRFLDVHDRTCCVYNNRFEIVDDCIKLTAENVPTLDWLPYDCAYRKFLKEA